MKGEVEAKILHKRNCMQRAEQSLPAKKFKEKKEMQDFFEELKGRCTYTGICKSESSKCQDCRKNPANITTVRMQ